MLGLFMWCGGCWVVNLGYLCANFIKLMEKCWGVIVVVVYFYYMSCLALSGVSKTQKKNWRSRLM